MEHALNIGMLVVMLVQTGVIVGITVVFASKMAVFKEQMIGFVTPVSEGQPSPIAVVAEQASEMIARAVMARAKMTFAGLSSGVARQEKAVDADIVEDVARMHPMVDAVLDGFPLLRKTLRKNPALFDMAMSKLVPMMDKQAQQRGANGVQNSSTGPGKISQ